MDIIEQIRKRQAESNLPDSHPLPDHKPEMLYIGCVDARLAIDSDIGIPKSKAMIFRNIAALVPKYTSNRSSLKKSDKLLRGKIPQDVGIGAVLEFYINELPYERGKIKKIAIAGHTNCGGLRACQCGHDAKNKDLSLYLHALKEAHGRINNQAKTEGWSETKTLRELEKESVRQSIANLLEYPAVKKAIKKKKLEIHGWLIDTATQRIFEMNPATLEFESMV